MQKKSCFLLVFCIVIRIFALKPEDSPQWHLKTGETLEATMDEKELYINFDEYIRQGEPQKRERAEAWRVAIGLQAVDGLKT